MTWQQWCESIGTGLACSALTVIVIGWLRGRRAARRRPAAHGIALRLQTTDATVMHVDCEELGLIYTYAGDRPRSDDGWLTLETLFTAAGLVLLQCKPVEVAR